MLLKGKNISVLAQQKADIAFLQETHLHSAKNTEMKAKWIQLQYHAKGSSKSRGVSILISKTVNYQHKSTLLDPNDRFIFIKGTIKNQFVTLALIYAPNSNYLEFIEEILTKLHNFQGETIIGGDFNYIINYKLDNQITNNIAPRKTTIQNY